MTEQPVVLLHVTRAKALLAAADPAPWYVRDRTPWGSQVVSAESGEMYVGVSARTSPPSDGWSHEAQVRAGELGRSKCANAELIAAAPGLIGALVEQIEMLTARVEGGWQRGYDEGWTEAMDHVRKVVGP